MASAAPESLPQLPPSARAAVAAVAAEPTTSVKLLVSGGIGAGKTAVVSEIRARLRAADIPVVTHPPRADDPPDVAVVIDDAHLLDDTALNQLADRVADRSATVVVAAEPLTHRPALRALSTALEREHPVVALKPLTAAEVHQELAAAFDVGPTPELVRSLMQSTSGLPLLLTSAIAAIADTDAHSTAAAVAQAAKFALIERLRRVDERVLDTVLVSSLSPDLGPDDVAGALRVTSEDAQSLVDRARATGLIEPSHSDTFVRSVHDCVGQIVGTTHHSEVEAQLLRSQLESSTLSADLALQLAEHGRRDRRLADALTELGTQSSARPALAGKLYRAAVDAGATTLNARLADALARTGDCATAGRLADELLTSTDEAERAAAVRIAASVAMHDGNAVHAAELFGWLGPYPDAVLSASGAIVALASGDLSTARSALTVQPAGPPTSSARAARSLADGLLTSLDQPFPVAIARLAQSMTADSSSDVVIPDTPAALVTLAALHGGDPVRARSVIGRATRAGGHGATHSGFSAHRHRLLLGWVRMQDGQLTAAAGDAAAAARGPDALHRRDALWSAALHTAIARRSGDTGALQKHWYEAMEVLAEYSVDLFALLPLGELWVAAARLRQLDRLQQPLAEAFALLERLGSPVLWSVPLHWAGVHAGILANSPDAVTPHARVLTASAATSAFAKALAMGGRTWLRVLANQVDTDDVSAAARSLAQFGLTWDATRLASQAALQTTDARTSQAMLQLARDLKQTVASDESDTGAVPAASAPASAPVRTTSARQSAPQLSEREREVAELLLLGMPYRDIGAQLFISAKTVEHHVARIRRRLGAESRSEMLSMLRAMSA